MDDLLQQGILAYKAGKREEARKIFVSVVKQFPENERAWAWMYQVSVNDKERIYCLKQMLRINPKNEKPSQLLNQLLAPSLAPIVQPPAPNQVNTPGISTRKCPRCQELIRAGAPRCRYCGWDSNEKKIVRGGKNIKNKIRSLLSALGVITIIVICGLIYGLAINAMQKIGPVATPTRTVEESAWYACTLFVENQLEVSIIDAQSYTPSGIILLDNGQYRVDVEYAKIATIFTCILLDHSGGSWELISLVATKK
jgi:hypothetical protein